MSDDAGNGKISQQGSTTAQVGWLVHTLLAPPRFVHALHVHVGTLHNYYLRRENTLKKERTSSDFPDPSPGTSQKH